MTNGPALRRPVPWVGLWLAVGIGLRAFHYLRDPSVWHDEAALLVNVLGKGFRGLLGPLYFAEAAPPLFLWLERAASLVFGDGTYSLRLLPFLASCASVLLVARAARQLLSAAAVPWAVLLLAGSDRLLWHSCEAKPYAFDVLAAAAMVALFAGVAHWTLRGRLLIFAVLAPLFIFLCYPGCFLFGGLLVAVLPELWRDRKPATLLAYGVLVGAVFGSFLTLLLGPIHAQRHELMNQCWVNQFPNWQRPASVPPWMLFSTFDVVRYCFEPTGHALALLAAAGAVLLWRGGQRSLVILLLLPLGLALAAACVGAYPYGGARVEAYAAPALALLIAAAVPSLAAWLRERSRLGSAALTLLLVAPLGLALLHAVVPWPRADCAGAAAYVLGHRQADDAVTGNHWEHQYYFRSLGSGFQYVNEMNPTASDRLWLLVTGGTPNEERAIVAQLANEWRPVAEQPFERTTVYLLTRVVPPASQSVPRRSRP